MTDAGITRAGRDGKRGDEPDLAERIARNLKAGRSLEAEMAVLTTLPPDKRSEVERKLVVMDDYLRSERSMADADRAAAAMGTKIRNLYRLVARMADAGPVGGLASGFRNKPRPSTSRDGIGEPVDGWIRAALKERPAARVAEIGEELALRREELATPAERKAVTLPSPSVLRRRVQALRRDAAAAAGRAFGRSLAIDQIALDLPVHATVGSIGYAVATILFDPEMRLIGGVGLAAGDGIGIGLQAALADAVRTRLPAFERVGVPIADRLQKLVWVVPPGIEEVAPALADAAATLSPELDLTVKETGTRRHGVEIMRVLGDRLDRIRFRARSTQQADKRAVRAHATEAGHEVAGTGSRLGIDAETLPGQVVAGNIDDVTRVVRHAADVWNRARLSDVKDSGNKLDEASGQDAADHLASTLRKLFYPVFERIQDRFEPSDGRPAPKYDYF